MPLQFGELAAIIGALHLHRIQWLLRGDHQAIGYRHGDDVRQVVLTLRVAVGEAPEPVTETLPRHSENSGIAFGDQLLLGRCVLVLDDRLHHALVITHDSAVAGRIVQVNREQRNLLRADLVQEPFERGHLDQGDIAIEDQHSLGAQGGQRLRHRVAGTELLCLDDEIQIIGGQPLANLVGTVPDHDMNSIRRELPCSGNNVTEHGLPGDRMQDFRQGGTHTRPLARSKDDDIERHEADPFGNRN